MKTKFILHGGMTSVEAESNDNFFKEFVKDLDQNATILYVGLARESEEEQQDVFERDKKKILGASEKTLHIENAKAGTLGEQLSRADAVYATGGTSKILKERFRQVPDLKQLLSGKVYAGSSAGVNALSAYHTSYGTEGVQVGLGVLPFCVMCHYGEPDYNGIKEHEPWFDDVRGDMELIHLPECEWVVREIEL